MLQCNSVTIYNVTIYNVTMLKLGLCKLENKILKEVKNAEKSHFKTKKGHFWLFLASFKISFSSLNNPSYNI